MGIYFNTIFIAPMTSSLKEYPFRVAVNHNEKKGMMTIDQIIIMDKKRIIN